MREGEGNERAGQLGAILCMLNTNNARRKSCLRSRPASLEIVACSGFFFLTSIQRRRRVTLLDVVEATMASQARWIVFL
jgi:hypothetical protein